MSLGVISGHLSTFRALDKIGGGGVRKVRETLERAGRKDKLTTLLLSIYKQEKMPESSTTLNKPNI